MRRTAAGTTCVLSSSVWRTRAARRGGRALPLTYHRQVRGLADRYGLQVHMDGTRLMNAAVARGVEPAQIAQHCDSVTLCFSKVCLCGKGPQGWQGPAQAAACPLFAGVGLRTHVAGWACTQEGQLPLGQLG